MIRPRTSYAGCPSSTLARVDLPDPFGPMRAWISPRCTVRSTPLRMEVPFTEAWRSSMTSRGWSAMAAQDIRTGPPTGWFGGLRASAGRRSAGRQDHVLPAGHRHVHVDVPGLGDAGHRHGHGDRRLQFTLDHDAGHRVEPGGHQRGGPQPLELDAPSRRLAR